MIQTQRLTASIEGSFVVFLIGMRINKPWKIHKWLPVARAMPRMLAELAARPESGMLGGEMWFGRTTIMVQYWRSVEQLMAYAKDKEAAHLPAWREFNRSVGTNGDVGIWHETYPVTAGAHESIYVNMPAFGLGKAGSLQPASGMRQSAEDRLKTNRHTHSA
jgi:hypothetical protein